MIKSYIFKCYQCDYDAPCSYTLMEEDEGVQEGLIPPILCPYEYNASWKYINDCNHNDIEYIDDDEEWKCKICNRYFYDKLYKINVKFKYLVSDTKRDIMYAIYKGKQLQSKYNINDKWKNCNYYIGQSNRFYRIKE